MSQTVERVTAEQAPGTAASKPAARTTHKMLVRRYDEANEAWTRQEAAIVAMREGLDTGPGDDVDQATSRNQLDEQIILADGLRHHLDELTVAMQRDEAGVYGLCERCGQIIPEERLLLFPAATHCVACKQAVERH